MKPVSPSTEKRRSSDQRRVLLSLALGFVAWRLSIEVMALIAALTLALIVAGCTWTLTRPRT